MRPPYYRGCWHGVSRRFLPRYRQNSSLGKGVYNPRTFILHAVLLRQACAHCGKFLTAAHRSGLDRVSVPVWLIILSNQLLIIALVGLYPTNKLIRRKLIHRRKSFHPSAYRALTFISERYSLPMSRVSRVTHPFATRYFVCKHTDTSFDLHVLSIQLAFNLSQSQTRHKIKYKVH